MSTPAPAPPRSTPTAPKVLWVVKRARRRIAAQRGLGRALVAAALGVLGAAVLLVLIHRGLAAPGDLLLAGVGGAALAVAAFASGVFRAPSGVGVAARVDAASDNHSALANALAFSETGPTSEMERLAIARGEAASGEARWREAFPWRFADFGWQAGTLGGAIVVLLVVMQLPAWTAEGRVAAAVSPLPELGGPAGAPALTLSEPGKDALRRLGGGDDEEEAAGQAATERDRELGEALDGLDALIAALLDGELSAEEAFARLADLDASLERWEEEVGSPMAGAEDKAAEAAEATLKESRKASEELAALLDAMRRKAWREAAEAAERTAGKLGEEGLSKREQEDLAKGLERLAEKLRSERQARRDALKREEDRLKKKGGERPEERLTQKERDRLEELQRELEQLSREDKEVSEAMRQLERLARDYEDLARELMKRFNLRGEGGAGQGGERGEGGQRTASEAGGSEGGEGGAKGGEGQRGGPEEALRRAAEMLRKMAAGEEGRGDAEEARARIERLREVLRREGEKAEAQVAGAGEQGEGQQGAGQQGEGQEGAGQQGAGQQGAGQQGEDQQGAGQQGAGQQGAGQQGAGRQGAGQQGAGQQGAGQEGAGQQGAGQQGAGQQGAGQQGAGQQGAGQQGAGQQGAGQGQPGGPGDGQGQPGGGGDDGPQVIAETDAPPGAEGAARVDGGEGAGPARVGTAGAGVGHDKNLLGDPTRLDGKTQAELVRGQQGKGPSTSRILEATAERGFATEGYAEVLQDYRTVVEDALKAETIPPGKRGYVRRYFDLISPRPPREP
jgi:hypothetical protein